MRITVGQLRRIIRETIELEEARMDYYDRGRRNYLRAKNFIKKALISDLSPEEYEELQDLQARYRDEIEADEEMERYRIGPGAYSSRPYRD